MNWKPASEPPAIFAGTLVHVVVALRMTNGSLQSVGAVYLHDVECENEDGDDEECGFWNGFHFRSVLDYCDCWYEPIDNVVVWQPMPEPPEE